MRNVDYKCAGHFEVDLAACRNIIEIDKESMVVNVEPVANIGQITRATNPMNLALDFVVELDDLTVGGLINSYGIKGSSHIFDLIPGHISNLYLACHLLLCVEMGGSLGKKESSKTYSSESKLDAKMVEAMSQRATRGSTMKSFNTIIIKFSKIDESFRKCKDIFKQFDEDSNGAIDPEELKRCFHKLQVDFTEEEISDIFKACDIDENMAIKFNEFIVLLCLVYLLKEPTTTPTKSQLGLPELESTFQTLVDAFVFLDKNKDGHVSKSEMVEAINESTSGGRSSGRIAMRRFEEMDWDKNGMVTFKEFLFAFTRWLGIGGTEEDDEE